jgi:hypothetical protein
MIRFWAIYPCPWPNESIFRRVSIYFYLARERRYEMGSAPGLSTNIMGVVHEESLNEPLRSKTGDSMNILPRMLRTKFLMKVTNFYYLNIL